MPGGQRGLISNSFHWTKGHRVLCIGHAGVRMHVTTSAIFHRAAGWPRFITGLSLVLSFLNGAKNNSMSFNWWSPTQWRVSLCDVQAKAQRLAWERRQRHSFPQLLVHLVKGWEPHAPAVMQASPDAKEEKEGGAVWFMIELKRVAATDHGRTLSWYFFSENQWDTSFIHLFSGMDIPGHLPYSLKSGRWWKISDCFGHNICTYRLWFVTINDCSDVTAKQNTSPLQHDSGIDFLASALKGCGHCS